MYEYTERLKLPLLIPNQSGKEITHNEALITIDNLLQNHVISKNLNTPPDSFNIGDIYIVSSSATNDWLGKENQLAIFDNGWRFLKPINGMLFYVLDENCFYVYKDNWIKLENLIDFTKLKNITINNNLQKDELIKYNGNSFVNTREINLLKLYINDKLLIDENLNIKIKNGENLDDVISITSENIDLKSNLKISGMSIDSYIIDVINNNVDEFVKKDLSNLTQEGQNTIKNLVDQNTLNINLSNISETGINNLQNYLIPDYNSTIDFSNTIDNNTVTYTAPNNGVINISAQSTGPGNITIQAIINDIVIGQSTFNGGTPILNGQYVIGKDDIFKLTITGGTFYLPIASFTPFKDNN